MNDWFEWNGTRCTEYGIVVAEQPPITIPQERSTQTKIPGRPGSLTQLEGDDDDMQYEFRFYLNKGRLIKAIIKRKNWQEQDFKEVWSGTTLKPIYKSAFDEYKGVSRTMRELFINIEKEAY